MKIIVLDTLQTTGFDPITGDAVRQMRVRWRIDAHHGPYNDYFPLDGFDGNAVRQQLEAKADKIIAVAGS